MNAPLRIQEQRGVFYCEQPTLNSCNIVSGTSPRGAYETWLQINRRYFTHEIKQVRLQLSDKDVTIPLTDFLQHYQ